MGENITSSRARTRVRSFLLSLSPLQGIQDFITESAFKVPEPHSKRLQTDAPESGGPAAKRYRPGDSGSSDGKTASLDATVRNMGTSTGLGELRDSKWMDVFFKPRFAHEETGFPIIGSPDGHDDLINSVAFSPDGERVVSGSGDGTVRIWSAATGQFMGTLTRGEHVLSVAFSQYGGRVASGGADDTIRIWDAKAGAFELNGHTDYVCCVAFSPNGKLLASGGEEQDCTVRIWDLENKRQIHELKGHTEAVNDVSFSPDGTHVASGGDDKTIRIWDLESKTGESQCNIGVHNSRVLCVTFSPNGERLASGYHQDPTVRIWDVDTKKLQRELKGHSDGVESIAFSPDGERLATASKDTTVHIWDLAANTFRELKGHKSAVNSVAFSPNGKRVVTGSVDGTIRIWERLTSEELIKRTSGVKRVPNWVRSVVHALQEPALRITVLDCLNTIWYEVVRIGSPE